MEHVHRRRPFVLVLEKKSKRNLKWNKRSVEFDGEYIRYKNCEEEQKIWKETMRVTRAYKTSLSSLEIFFSKLNCLGSPARYPFVVETCEDKTISFSCSTEKQLDICLKKLNERANSVFTLSSSNSPVSRRHSVCSEALKHEQSQDTTECVDKRMLKAEKLFEQSSKPIPELDQAMNRIRTYYQEKMRHSLTMTIAKAS